MMRLMVISVAAGALLAACQPAAEEGAEKAPAAAAEADRTLAQALGGALKATAENAGLGQVLEGAGPYTVLAPTDAAFQTGGDALDLRDEAEKAPAAALVRGHLLPGALTRADIEAALARQSDGKAEVRTLDGGSVTFSRDGQGVLVTAANGATARLTAQETRASNGVIQPVDAVLVPKAG